MKRMIGILIWIVIIILSVIAIVFIIGLFLPKERVETRESIFDASPKTVYDLVTNNKDWSYRSDLKALKIISVDGDIETWDEISQDGTIIRFKTRDKKPYSFYSFDMESKVMSGYWTAEFKEVKDGKTLFTATEYIKMKNPILRTLSYIFFDIGRFMEVYQSDLDKKIKDQHSPIQ